MAGNGVGTRVAVTLGAGLLFLFVGAFPLTLLCFGLATWQLLRSSVGEHPPDGADGAEDEQWSTCSTCGATVRAGRDHCEDCGVVGDWRK